MGPFGGGGGGGGKGGKGGGGKGSINLLKKGLQYAGVLPGGKWSNDKNALFVSSLPHDTTDVDMYEIWPLPHLSSLISGSVRVSCSSRPLASLCRSAELSLSILFALASARVSIWRTSCSTASREVAH